MADLLEEQRDKTSPIAKALSYKASNNKGNSKDQEKKSSNPNPKKDSNATKEQDKKDSNPSKASKKKQKKKSSNREKQKGKEAAFALGYTLATGYVKELDSNESSSDNSSDSDSDLDSSSASTTSNATSKPTFSYSNNIVKNSLLYNTGSSYYICNNRASFRDFKPLKKGKTSAIIIVGGPIFPKGRGIAVFNVLVKKNPLEYRPLALLDTLYFLGIDTNLVSGLSYYLKGGYLAKDQLFLANKSPCGLLEPAKHGFFLQIKGQPTPTICKHLTHLSFIGSQYCNQ